MQAQLAYDRNTMQHLKAGVTLQSGKYRVESVLGQGGFGITYLAEQTMLGRKVAIKEFFMKDFCERDENSCSITTVTANARATVERYREKFLKEARNMVRLKHANIVRIIDVFEENTTVYYVMEYAEKGSLDDKVKRERYLSQANALRYILQVADALDYVHRNKMTHLDVKPANIMLNASDEAVLIDFGLSKQYDSASGNQTSTTPVGISEGYAPMEQYNQGGVGEFSPETDIYALGATLFKLLTGKTPASASDILENGVDVAELEEKGIQQYVIDVICQAMKPRKRDRLKSMCDFIDALNNHTVAQAAPAETFAPAADESTRLIMPTPAAQPAPQPEAPADEVEYAEEDDNRRDLTKKVIIICASVLVVVGGLFWWSVRPGGGEYVSQADLNKALSDSAADGGDSVAQPAEEAAQEAAPAAAEEDGPGFLYDAWTESFLGTYSMLLGGMGNKTGIEVKVYKDSDGYYADYVTNSAHEGEHAVRKMSVSSIDGGIMLTKGSETHTITMVDDGFEVDGFPADH